MQQMINAAIAAFGSIHIKTIQVWTRIEPGTLCTESRHSTVLLRSRPMVLILVIQLYLKQTAYKAALNKRLFNAALNPLYIQLLLYVILYKSSSTACAANI